MLGVWGVRGWGRALLADACCGWAALLEVASNPAVPKNRKQTRFEGSPQHLAQLPFLPPPFPLCPLPSAAPAAGANWSVPTRITTGLSIVR